MGELHILGEFAVRSTDALMPRCPEPRLVESDAEYFERRSREEASFAAEIACEKTRLIHLELAGRHALLAAAIREAAEKTA